MAELLTPQGELRTLPCHWAYDPEPRMGGLDGFYAARIIRNDGGLKPVGRSFHAFAICCTG